MDEIRPLKNKVLNINSNLVHIDMIGDIIVPDSFMAPDKNLCYVFHIQLKNNVNFAFTDPDPHALINKYEKFVEDWLGRTPEDLGIDCYVKLNIDRYSS